MLGHSNWVWKIAGALLSAFPDTMSNPHHYTSHMYPIKDFYLLHICQYWEYWFSDHMCFVQVAGLPEAFDNLS